MTPKIDTTSQLVEISAGDFRGGSTYRSVSRGSDGSLPQISFRLTGSFSIYSMRLLFPIPLKCHNADPVHNPCYGYFIAGESQKSYPIVKDEDRTLHKDPCSGIAAPLDACLGEDLQEGNALRNAMRRYTALQSVAMARSTRGSSSQSALFRSPQTTGLKDPEKYVL